MNKYLAIVDSKTLVVCVVCALVSYFCYTFNFSHDLDITMFSIAVIFPLVFTIREAFKRRDSALKFLSLFKASMGSVHYCLEQCTKLSAEDRTAVHEMLQSASRQFLETMNSQGTDNSAAEATIDNVILFVRNHGDEISRSMAVKIIRFAQDVNESMQNTISLKMHGTPISMRAYCLVFVFMFPFVFTPTITYHLPDASVIITYGLSILHGFILISLYNVQGQMENPFDQVGLDDIMMDEYGFKRECSPPLLKAPKQPRLGKA